MLVEALVALALFGVVLTAIAEVHHTVAKLSQSASAREEREVQLLNEHFKDPSHEAICSTTAVVPFVANEICCELEIKITDSSKRGRTCKLSPDAGSGLIGLIMASFCLMLLAMLSFPTIRQLMIQKKVIREHHAQNLSAAETESEIQRVLFDNQSLRIPGITRVISQSDPVAQLALGLINKKFTPDSKSSILFTSNIDFRNLLLPTNKNIFKNGDVEFQSCGTLPKDTAIVAGFFDRYWSVFTVRSRKSIFTSNCSQGLSLGLSNLEETFDDSSLLGVAPLSESDLYYLDNNKSLRRYSLIQNKTTPIDYGFLKFVVNQSESTFEFALTKKDREEERNFNFKIELNSTNETSILSLLL